MNKISQRISDYVTLLRFKAGLLKPDQVAEKLLPQREKLIRSVPIQEQQGLRNLLKSMDSLTSVSDFSGFMGKALSVARNLEYIANTYDSSKLGPAFKEKSNYYGALPLPTSLQGGLSWGVFVNPFAPFTFFAEQQWSVRSATNIICNQVRKNAYSIKPTRGSVSPERVVEVDRFLKRVGFPEMRIQILKAYLTYRNVLVLPHKHMLDGFQKFDVLRMDRVMPAFDTTTERIVGWDYWIGNTSMFLRKDQVLHLREPSLQHPDLGIPTAAPIAIDLETDLASSGLNAAAVNSAGMIGVVLSLRPDMGVNDETASALARRLEEEIMNNHTGYRHANSVLASNLIEKATKIAGIGDYEASYLKFTNEIGRKTATVYDLPPERLNVVLKSGGVYEAVGLKDKSRELVDNTVFSNCSPVDEFCNNLILPLYGIDDCKIEANGRYGSMTLNSSRAAFFASQTGPLFDVNDALEIFYGVPPLPSWDPRGKIILDNSLNRDPDSVMPMESKPDPFDTSDIDEEVTDISEVDEEDD